MLLSVEIFGADLGPLLTFAVHQANERMLWQEAKATEQDEHGAEMWQHVCTPALSEAG